ncbi:hypothetical protein PAXRUDRAFT_649046 [Paxillus rubicundulus Ve08.2h10]|uniref:Uncharacterized protein n=1 Tax=Paxillus rubicundulus Ve08.2h10 TaxID=930991 RepID=A0A0D0E2M0_9AGAM|nr:hypothetical protein PAXRUDRAFT_649046 [Paxillus rubicundulus Ve08.2h10]
MHAITHCIRARISGYSTSLRTKNCQLPGPGPLIVRNQVDLTKTSQQTGDKQSLKVDGRTNDVDMAVMTNEDQESIKRRLVLADSRFYLMSARTPGATYQVLWFTLGHLLSRRSCKVDILCRGAMNIPDIPPHEIRHIGGLPIAPILVVLCLKLQAWDHHGAAVELRFRLKRPVDARDIAELLVFAVAGGEHVSKVGWLPQEFVKSAKTRVNDFLIADRATKDKWRALGLYQRVAALYSY